MKPTSLHNTALIGIWGSALVLPQVCGCLLDEVTSLVKADAVAFRIAHRLTNAEVIWTPSVAIFSRAFEVLNCFLFEFRHYIILA
jgi:hypothetical protein